MADQDLRSFVADYERAYPTEVIRVTEPVTLFHASEATWSKRGRWRRAIPTRCW